MELPLSDELNISALSASFKNVTNSYKYYWFWAILDTVRETNTNFITYETLSMLMLDLVWYPLDFFKLSFGKQDSFKLLANKIADKLTIDNTARSKSIHQQITSRLDKHDAESLTNDVTQVLKRYVSSRFLSSFFPHELRGLKESEINPAIERLSNQEPDTTPYSVDHNGIRLSEKWKRYFSDNYTVLKGFLKWELVKFLQKNNPYVIGLSEKIEKPGYRDLSIAKAFWNEYIEAKETKCIYSGVSLKPRSISLDHFIPWSYVVHDKLWNIIPTTRQVNSSKSDYLPNMDRYFDDLCALQYDALLFHLSKGNEIYIEDYRHIWGQENHCTFDIFSIRLKLDLETNIRSARALGFFYPYTFKSNVDK